MIEIKFCALVRHLFPALALSLLLTACIGHAPDRDPNRLDPALPPADTPIADFVVSIFEDTQGRLWFGTMAKGALYSDSTGLRSYTTADGLPGNTVTGFVEDADHNLWIGTHSGLSRFDGHSFTNFTTPNSTNHNRISNLVIDSKGNFWVGTWGGVYRFDGTQLSPFPIELPDITLPAYHGTGLWVTEIMEDSRGNIWFGWDGYGACRYDGHTFTWFNNTNGLASNNVQAICEDSQGDIWFGSRVAEHDNPNPDARTGAGGVAIYDGTSFTTFDTLNGLHDNDVYTIALDRSGRIWVGATGVGLYVFAGDTYQLYTSTNRMDRTAGFGVQGVLEDRNGQIWFGFSGGLFQLQGDQLVHVSREHF